MNISHLRHVSRVVFAVILGFGTVVGLGQDAGKAQTRTEQNDALFERLQQARGLSDEQMTAIRKIFAGSAIIGQGNPAVTHHPVTPEACQAKLKQMGVQYENPRFEKICKAKYMAPLTILPKSGRKTRRRASINSSFPIFHAPIRWSG